MNSFIAILHIYEPHTQTVVFIVGWIYTDTHVYI